MKIVNIGHQGDVLILRVEFERSDVLSKYVNMIEDKSHEGITIHRGEALMHSHELEIEDQSQVEIYRLKEIKKGADMGALSSIFDSSYFSTTDSRFNPSNVQLIAMTNKVPVTLVHKNTANVTREQDLLEHSEQSLLHAPVSLPPGNWIFAPQQEGMGNMIIPRVD